MSTHDERDDAHDDYLLDPRAAPDTRVRELEDALRPMRWRSRAAPDFASLASVSGGHTEPVRALGRVPRGVPTFLAAAGILVAVALPFVARQGEQPWTVRSGTAQGNGERTARLAEGSAVRTGAGGSARIAVGRIGRADVGPSSEVRIVRTGGEGGTEHRLALVRGRIHARIDAPPRWFIVETASALAVDLGCEYTLEVDSAGRGTLHVTEGEVELQHGAMRTAVPAGNIAALRPEVGPGLPRPASGSTRLTAAVARWERAHADGAAIAELTELVAAARAERATITLWHLVQRVAPAERGRVLDALAASGPVPPRVDRARAEALDSYTMQRWRTALEPAWSTTEPRWRRLLSALDLR